MSFTRVSKQYGLVISELMVYELYSKKKEGNTWELITDYFKGHSRITSDTYSSFEEESEPVVLKASYRVPFPVKALSMTETANLITGRTLVMAAADNRIYSLNQN